MIEEKFCAAAAEEDERRQREVEETQQRPLQQQDGLATGNDTAVERQGNGDNKNAQQGQEWQQPLPVPGKIFYAGSPISAPEHYFQQLQSQPQQGHPMRQVVTTAEKRPRRNGLMEAVETGDESSVGRMLGERRAEVDMIDQGGATPLMLACHQGNPQLGRCDKSLFTFLIWL